MYYYDLIRFIWMISLLISDNFYLFKTDKWYKYTYHENLLGYIYIKKIHNTGTGINGKGYLCEYEIYHISLLYIRLNLKL